MKTTFLITASLLLLGLTKSNAQLNNTLFGLDAGSNNTGSYNNGFGEKALQDNSGNSNSAFGILALSSNQGSFNCAFGNESLRLNNSGSLNSAFGTRSLVNNDRGSFNVAMGHRSMEANTNGNYNTAIGYASLLTNNGNGNIALGYFTPRSLLTGDSNIFIGNTSAVNLLNGSYNVFLGSTAVNNIPSTPVLAGNDTNSTIIFADGVGRQRMFIHKNGNVGIGLGNNVIPANRLDIKGGVVIGRNYTPSGYVSSTGQVVSNPGAVAPTNGLLVEGNVGIGNILPKNKLEITQGTQGNSGLRFTNLTSNFNPPTTQTSNKFLSVNDNGDVVLQNVANAVDTNQLASTENFLTSNVNQISSSTTIINSLNNTINSNNQLITTVNGVASNPVTLPNLTVVPQTLSQSGNTITLSNNGGSFVLPTFTDTDSQSLALSGNTLSISNGNSVTLPAVVPQTLSQSGNTITLSNNGGSFVLPTFTDTDSQHIALSGNILSISNGNSVTLPAVVPQTLSQTGNTITLSNNGGSFTLPSPTQVVAGSNVTVTGNGSAATPFQINATDTDTSLYGNNGIINAATTINNNRVVGMNNSNIWFKTTSSDTNMNEKIYIGSTAVYPNTTGNYKLFVEGGILTEKVKVALRSSANWADYVFEENYKLMPLKKVAQYIANNKHLPGINSAEDLAKEGLDVAEMQAKHMEKIEELTLYAIEQDKKLEAQSKEIETLKLQVKALIEKTK